MSADVLPFKLSTRCKPVVQVFYEESSNTLTYLVQDAESNACAIIDSVLNLDYSAGRLTTESADKIIDSVTENSLELEWLIETHVHADHLSAAPYIQSKLGGKIAIGNHISLVQHEFAGIFDEGAHFDKNGKQFDHLFKHGERYTIGKMQAYALSTPGHTPACMTHVVGDAVFVGDTLFMPDSGTARADFPGGDAKTLYESIQLILSLPSRFRIFVCHDYQPGGRDLSWQSSVEEQRKSNIHVQDGISIQEYVDMRTMRDKTLSMPKLLIPSIQVNIRAGRLPDKAKGSNTVYLKVPINKL